VLTRSGLYSKEARAMVNTWTNSYFRSEGTRVLFVLPQSWTDSFIPMTIDPEPKELVRVMVGRVELLTPERERLAEAAVRALALDDPVKRGEAFRFLHDQGRYVEAIVRRLMKTTTDDGVRTLCRRLLLTELVTDLRAAVNHADDGRWINVHPQLLHGQMARMLREAGLDAEARAEGSLVLLDLKPAVAESNKMPAETPTQIEARAAALEAVGDDRSAAASYARRVELEALSMSGELPEASIAWLRDWWVGRAYARCLSRAGAADSALSALARELDRKPALPTGTVNARATTLLLAYLSEFQGKHALAELHWSSLAGKPAPQASVAPSHSVSQSGPRSGT
jgi:hypothetical protein